MIDKDVMLLTLNTTLALSVLQVFITMYLSSCLDFMLNVLYPVLYEKYIILCMSMYYICA